MKVRNLSGKWIVLDEGREISRHTSKSAALLSIGYRGREIPKPPEPVSPKAPPFLKKEAK